MDKSGTPHFWVLVLMLALGVFVGNWLSGPFIIEGRTYAEGAVVGLISAMLVIIAGFFIRRWL